MDIGSEFDDDFFENPKEKEANETAKYEAKVCVPLWYMEDQKVEKEPADMLVALKHKADFHYFSKEYAKAAETYEKCLQLVPPSNNTWIREFLENLSRCFLHLGNAETALEWGLKLYESSFNADQKVISMNLLATICHKLGKYKEELEALHCCIDTHKSCPEFWLRLGLCYAGLFKFDLPGCSILRPSLDEDQEPCCAFNSKFSGQKDQDPGISHPALLPEHAVASGSTSASHTDNCSKGEIDIDTFKCEICTLGIQIVSSCFIHTRMLIDSGGPNPLGIERDEKIKKKIDSSLKHMEVDQSFIDVASTMLGTDFLSGLQESRDNLDQQESFFDKLKADKVV